MLLTEIADESMRDWQFEVLRDGSNGGTKGETLGFDVFSKANGMYYLTPIQIKQYFAGMKVGDIRIIMAKSGSIKVARSA